MQFPEGFQLLFDVFLELGNERPHEVLSQPLHGPFDDIGGFCFDGGQFLGVEEFDNVRHVGFEVLHFLDAKLLEQFVDEGEVPGHEFGGLGF
jgi:hypothetical protein